MVGVSKELSDLFLYQKFLVALYTVDVTPEFRKQKDALLNYWITWLEDVRRQVAPWLLLGNIDDITPVGVELKQSKLVIAHLSLDDYIEWCQIMGRESYDLMAGCPFRTTFESELNYRIMGNLFTWAVNREDIPTTLGELNVKNVLL